MHTATQVLPGTVEAVVNDDVTVDCAVIWTRNVSASASRIAGKWPIVG